MITFLLPYTKTDVTHELKSYRLWGFENEKRNRKRYLRGPVIQISKNISNLSKCDGTHLDSVLTLKENNRIDFFSEVLFSVCMVSSVK